MKTKEKKFVGISPTQSRGRPQGAHPTSYGVKILAFLVLLSAAAILIFLGLKIYSSFSYAGEYTIDLDPEYFRDESSPLYINENLNGEKFGRGGVVNNEHYFEITGSPLEFVWQPEEFPINKDVKVGAQFKGNAFLELGIPCAECGEEKYKWEPFYDPTRNPAAITASFENEAGSNYKKKGAVEIKNEIKGSQVFYVYLEDKIDLSISKISLNPYGIEKDIKVTLADLEGTTVWKDKIPYVTSEETSFRFESAFEEKGIYKLSITNPLDDFIITGLSINSSSIASADTILSGINIEAAKDDWIVAEKYIEGELEDKKAVHFMLRNQILEEKKEKEEAIRQRGFEIVQEFSAEGGKDFLIWKRDDAPALHLVVPDSESTLGEFLTLSIPEGGIIEGDKELGIVREAPEGFVAENTTISANLRGDHSFYLYLSDSLKSNITTKELNWYEGADDITVTLSTKNEKEELCQRIIADDGNTSTDKQEKITTIPFECNNLTPGIYLLSFKESSSKKDYVIEELNLNTNKIVAKGGVLNLKPIPLYVNVLQEKDLKFYYWHDNLDQEITLGLVPSQTNADLPAPTCLPCQRHRQGLRQAGWTQTDAETKHVLTLTKEDKGQNIFYTLTPGMWEINASKGNLIISGDYFVFSPEHWFAVEPNYIVTKKIDDEIITLKNVIIIVE